jgi:mannan polymerase II complex MNN10 subunit
LKLNQYEVHLNKSRFLLIAGVFFFRKSEWSERFLDIWWNQTSFVQFGSTKSGDNAALMYLIENLPTEELQAHVRISPMQCLFNSYPWFLSKKTVYRLMLSPWTTWQGWHCASVCEHIYLVRSTISEFELTMWFYIITGAYSEGDFMVHLAGIKNKKKWVSKIIQDMITPRRTSFFNPNWNFFVQKPFFLKKKNLVKCETLRKPFFTF